ncbi:hypothetical protein D3C80_1528940 [compost metagenome]
MEFRWIELLFLNIFGRVERVQRTDDHLFRHRTGEQPHGCLPVVFVDANRFEQWGNHTADGGQRRVVDIIRSFALKRKAVQRAEENADNDDHFTGT